MLIFFLKRFGLTGSEALMEREYENIACKDSEGPSTQLLSVATPSLSS